MLLFIMMLVSSLDPHLVRQKDPITDQESVMAIWLSQENALTIACQPSSKTIRVGFISKLHDFGHTGLLNSAWPLTFRFDNQKPVTYDWMHDRDTAQLASSKEIVSFIHGALNGSSVVLRAKDNFGNGEQFDTAFELGNSKLVVSQVVRACGDTKILRALNSELSE